MTIPHATETQIRSTDPANNRAGSLSVASRSGGSRWYARVSFPEAVAVRAGIESGARLSVTPRPEDGCLILEPQPDGRLKLQAAKGRRERCHENGRASGRDRVAR